MRRLRQLDTFTLVAAVLVLVPAVAAVVMALREPWMPTTDWARIEFAVRDVGTADTPLVGPYSRFGWDHPGPLMFYVMAPLYHLVPADHGLLFAAAMTNLLFSLAFVLVALRYPRTRALVVLVAFALLSRGIGVGDLTDPWNPTITLVPFALFLLLCVEVVEGRQVWPLPAVVAVACFVGQSHAGLLPVVFLVGGTALGLRLWRRRQAASADDDPGSDGHAGPPITARTAALTGGLGLVLWLPPLIDQVGSSGNLGALARFTVGMDDTPLGPIQQGALAPGEVVTTSSWLLNPLGRWWRDPGTPVEYGFNLLGSASPVYLLLLVAMLAAAFVRPRYLRRQTTEGAEEDSWGTSAAVVTAASAVATFVAMISLRGTPFYYLGRWTTAVMMMLWVALGWSLAPVLRERFRWLEGSKHSTASADAAPEADRAPRLPVFVMGGAAAGLIGVIGLSAVLHQTATRQPAGDHSDALRRLEPAMRRVARTEEPVATTLDREVILFNDITQGFVVWLDRNGVDWIDSVSDPDADGRYHYSVESLKGLVENPLLEESEIEIVATSGSLDGDEDDEGELALTRIPVERVRDVAWSEGRFEGLDGVADPGS